MKKGKIKGKMTSVTTITMPSAPNQSNDLRMQNARGSVRVF